jgi:hypothetical protein
MIGLLRFRRQTFEEARSISATAGSEPFRLDKRRGPAAADATAVGEALDRLVQRRDAVRHTEAHGFLGADNAAFAETVAHRRTP